MHCDIYKSSKKDEMYLYIAHSDSSEESRDPLKNLPQSIYQVFGSPIFVMHLELNEHRKLARVNVIDVIQSLKEVGFFIQMPPEGFINQKFEPEGLRGA